MPCKERERGKRPSGDRAGGRTSKRGIAVEGEKERVAGEAQLRIGKDRPSQRRKNAARSAKEQAPVLRSSEKGFPADWATRREKFRWEGEKTRCDHRHTPRSTKKSAGPNRCVHSGRKTEGNGGRKKGGARNRTERESVESDGEKRGTSGLLEWMTGGEPKSARVQRGGQ